MIEGMDVYMKQLERLKNVPKQQEVLTVIEQGWSIVTEQIRSNAISEFNFNTGLLFDTKTILTNVGRAGEDGNYIYAEAGVFRDDSAMGARGLTRSDIPAPMYAHWLEFGTDAHHVEKDWRRKKTSGQDHTFSVARKRGYSETAPVASQRSGIRATYFISKASDSKQEQANTFIVNGLNQLIDEVAK